MSDDLLRLEDKVAVVTGAASGMGAAIAIALAGAGARTVLVDRDRNGLETVERGIVERGQACTVFEADLMNEEVPSAIIEHTTESYGHLDVLVHAAGIFEQAALGECSRESLERQLLVNAVVPFMLSKAALPHFRRPGAAIIFISSIGAQVGWAECSAYTLSKGGIEAVSRALAVELAPAGVRVNTVAPGTTDTPMNKEMFAIPGMKDEILAKIPAGRIAVAEDIALPVLFLASDAARHIVGATITVDGGYVAQ